MKVTTENNINEYILDRIKKVYIGFDDNTEVKLDNVVEYDIDLDNFDMSIIEITNALFNVEIENRFKGKKSNHIIYIHIEATGVTPYENESLDVFYDIPCDMKIRRYRTNASHINIGNMFVELEGFIK